MGVRPTIQPIGPIVRHAAYRTRVPRGGRRGRDDRGRRRSFGDDGSRETSARRRRLVPVVPPRRRLRRRAGGFRGEGCPFRGRPDRGRAEPRIETTIEYRRAARASRVSRVPHLPRLRRGRRRGDVRAVFVRRERAGGARFVPRAVVRETGSVACELCTATFPARFASVGAPVRSERSERERRAADAQVRERERLTRLLQNFGPPRTAAPRAAPRISQSSTSTRFWKPRRAFGGAPRATLRTRQATTTTGHTWWCSTREGAR